MKYPVRNSEGQSVGTVELDAEVFGAVVDPALVHEAVRWQRLKKRAGSHACLSKGQMKGGGRKPWRQKGTGRARCGSNTSPVWVGGGVAHGPKPRDYSNRFAKGDRARALIGVLSDKARSSELVVLDSFKAVAGKTREVKAVFQKLGVLDGGVTLVMAGVDDSAIDTEMRAARNLSGVIALPVQGANAYDLLKSKYLVTTAAGVQALQSLVKGRIGKAGGV